MKLIASKFIGSSVCTIRSTGKVGQVVGLLIDPNKLVVAGFWVATRVHKDHQLLLNQDIRTLVPEKHQVIIDDLKDLCQPADLERLKPILEIDYQIPGKKVVQAKKRLGKAIDFGFSIDYDYQITNIIAKPTLNQRFRVIQLSFNRNQIQAIDDKTITIQADELKQKVGLKVRASYKQTGYPAASSSKLG